jgi:hypothetical protein
MMLRPTASLTGGGILALASPAALKSGSHTPLAFTIMDSAQRLTAVQTAAASRLAMGRSNRFKASRPVAHHSGKKIFAA